MECAYLSPHFHLVLTGILQAVLAAYAQLSAYHLQDIELHPGHVNGKAEWIFNAEGLKVMQEIVQTFLAKCKQASGLL